MKIGQLILMEIQKQNYTQKELAEAIGITETAMSQLLKGVYNPRQGTLDKICDELNVDLVMKFEPR